MFRREFIKQAPLSMLVVQLAGGAVNAGAASAQPANAPSAGHPSRPAIDVRQFGAAGDGKAIDSVAINRAIEAASAGGGGTVLFPAGTYLCYTLRLKSHITLHLEAGATLLAADVPREGTTTGGYDPAGPPLPWEKYEDFGHNHWANSLIYGEGLENIAITGTGLIWGKGLSRGEPDEFPKAESPGVGNKSISLKNCRNVQLREFSVLMGGHFAILLTGVDNVWIDGLTIDTNRDGMDIDCCRNVRVSNCIVNSPWDDAICAKSSFALGEPRVTENVMITNCYVTGDFEFGTVLDGTFKRRLYDGWRKAIGRIKYGTESNGGFRNVTISNCVFEACRGLALLVVDGGVLEDVCINNLTMRNLVHPPITMRLGRRMSGPETHIKKALRRVSITNLISTGAAAAYPSIIAGIPGCPIEDVRMSDVFVEQTGDGSKEWAQVHPAEREDAYPDADMFGPLPATGFLLRHVRGLQMNNVEIRVAKPDLRPAIWAEDLDDLDLFRLRVPEKQPAIVMMNVRNFRISGSRGLADRTKDLVTRETI